MEEGGHSGRGKRSMIENFGETYVERARRLREQLANLQPIP